MQSSESIDLTVVKRTFVYPCRYPNCKNKYYKNERNKRMHKFPMNEKLCGKWKEICNIEESRDCRSYRICADHFKDEDYGGFKRLKLNGDAVPGPLKVTAYHSSADKNLPEETLHDQHLSKFLMSSYNLTSSISEHLFACIGAPEAYKCNICNFTSDLKVILSDHAVQVHNIPTMKHTVVLAIKKLECQHCNFQTYSFLVFEVHRCNPYLRRRRKRSNKLLRCEHCLYTTKDDYFLRIHFRKHIKSHIHKSTDPFACTNILDLYKCRICDFTTHLYVLLKNHTLKAHKTPQLFNFIIESHTCSACNFQTFSVVILRKHVCTYGNNLMEHQNKWYRCTLCSFTSQRAPYLNQHFKRKHPSATMYKCHRCTYTFVDRTHLENHLKRHVNWFYCEFCKYKTNLSANLKMHSLLVHEDDHKIKWFRCEHCDYKSKTKSHLMVHLKGIHSGERNIKWFNCKECEYKSLTKTKLERHSLEQHGQHVNEWFNCEHCKYKSKIAYNLKLHTINKHTDHKEIQWFQCELCERKFKQKGSLQKHVRNVHTDVNTVITCEHCQYKTKKEAHMRRHILTRHTNDRDINWFECEHCKYRGKQLYSLQLHVLRRHPREAERRISNP